MIHCPLCNEIRISFFHQDRWRSYQRCTACKLVFVPSHEHLDPAAEKAEYDLHQNSPDDLGYRKFLSRLLEPVLERVSSQSCGLDFGSGPGPTLSVMFEEAGHEMAIYDPFYAPDTAPLKDAYDFVTASEVLEHLRRPSHDLDQLWQCVKPGGVLGVMTKLVLGEAEFANWHYKNDRTHVSFFSRETFEWLAKKWGATVTFVGQDVVLLAKR